MGVRWTVPGGWTIQTVDDGHGQQIFRVSRWHDWLILYPADLDALEELLATFGIGLADLTEDETRH